MGKILEGGGVEIGGAGDRRENRGAGVWLGWFENHDGFRVGREGDEGGTGEREMEDGRWERENRIGGEDERESREERE